VAASEEPSVCALILKSDLIKKIPPTEQWEERGAVSLHIRWRNGGGVQEIDGLHNNIDV
jgi:hypothetical protein